MIHYFHGPRQLATFSKIHLTGPKFKPQYHPPKKKIIQSRLDTIRATQEQSWMSYWRPGSGQKVNETPTSTKKLGSGGRVYNL
jgi:hypothetical protein